MLVLWQDFQGSTVDFGRVLLHQGGHPERDDRNPKVPRRGEGHQQGCKIQSAARL